MKLRIYFGIAENFDEKKFDDNNNNGNTDIYFSVPKLCNILRDTSVGWSRYTA